MSSWRVLHLPYGIGIGVLSQALRARGVDAVSCSLRSHRYAYMADIRMHVDEYSYRAGKQVREAFFREALETYDLFHFHFGETFFPDKRDLKIIRDRGKKMIVHHRGSEARMLSVARSFGNPHVRVKPTWPEMKIRANLRRLSAYIEHAIVPDRELLPYVAPYYKKVHIVPYAIDTGRYIPDYPSPDSPPLVVHAPSHREIKGTDDILSTVTRLRREGYKFDFKLIERMPHLEAQRLYRQASIVIDQLRIGSYANLSIEAMAMGKPVICYIREDLRDTFPPDLPIVSADPDTIYAALRDLLRRPERWAELGMRGRRYVERHHSLEQVSGMLIDIYRRL
ncbi:glycosyltransferase family 4 protein [Paenibacillus antri]|uniref:Glycosyltransferase family 4 protein n=1 Tax=Paenibacillus antri TaxID=2582848 RepID=A0A5R9GBT8_9BACL|nr:glycosyltransferase family 4 protein [Paenibacillus antri]TLS50848.1 glycosyltransferase family 4 protein [Paenibacillus antri]